MKGRFKVAFILLPIFLIAACSAVTPSTSRGIGGTVFKPMVHRDLPDYVISEGEVFDVKLALEAWQPPTWQGVAGRVKEVKVYELLPSGVELVEAPSGAEVWRGKLSDALASMLSSEAKVEVEDFINNVRGGMVEVPRYPHLPIYVASSDEEVVLLVLTINDTVEYKAKIVDATQPLKIFMGSVVLEAEYEAGHVRMEVKRYGGPVTGDFVLHVNAPVDVKVPEPTKIECWVNVSMALSKGLGQVVAPAMLSYVPDVKEIAVMLRERLPETIPIVFDLSEGLENGRLSKQLRLTVVNQTVPEEKFKLCLELPQGLSLAVSQLVVKVVEEPPTEPQVKILLEVFDLGPRLSFDKPVTLNFTYTDELVFKLGIDEDKLCVVFYDEDAGRWRPLESYVDVSANCVCANVTHFTRFTVAEYSKKATALSLTTSLVKVQQGSMITITGNISPAMSTNIKLVFTRPDGSTMIVEVVSDEDGSFSYSFKPEVEGSWSVKAVFEGDLEHEASTSEAAIFTVEAPAPSPMPRCLIATAAFGSELEGPVRFLRCFRDCKVVNTRGGSAFMKVFNAWYYSWSPYVASVEYSNDGLRTAVRYALYPLIGSLMISQQVYDALSWCNAELAIVAAGVVASMMISLVYITPFTFLLKKALRMDTPWTRTPTKVAASWLVGSLAMHSLGLLLGADLALKLSSTCIVLASMALPPSILALRKAA
ncbi:MAG: hypothetical protein DRJ69_00775 [Thermoprotei archaeon]|nr:MAG: hypothetical protein DRJ69_00775 [Thermoprotei archaeon]